MTQFCFLQQINHIVISWIINECVHHNIPTEQILEGVGSPLSMLDSISDPQDACGLLKLWIERLMEQLAGTNTESERIRQVIAYLNENHHRDLSLQSIADHFHIHKVYLSRSFKEETGTNLNSYLNYLRIEKAKLLLCMKTYRTNEIAYMVGFNNTQNFYNAFRKQVGCSPSDYLEGMPDGQAHT
jgi:two-component system response regulator YesN